MKVVVDVGRSGSVAVVAVVGGVGGGVGDDASAVTGAGARVGVVAGAVLMVAGP